MNPMVDQELTGSATQSRIEIGGAYRSYAKVSEEHRVREGLGNEIPCSILNSCKGEDSRLNIQRNIKDHVHDREFTPWVRCYSTHIY